MGVLQIVELGTLLVLGASSNIDGFQPRRIAKLVNDVDSGPACVRGTIYETDKLNVSNVWALIVSDWSGCADSVSALNAARKRLPKLPILVVGSDDDASRIAAYEAGADDYAVATCCDRELRAHLLGLLRRCDPVEDAVALGDLRVWVSARVAFRAGQPIRLSNKEMELLLYLLSHRPEPASRADILRDVFELAHDPGTNVVEVHIHRLRSKIDSGIGSKLLKTVRGVGYVLDADFENDAADQPAVRAVS